MSLRRIAVRIELPPSGEDRIAVEYAFRLAQSRGAELDVLVYVTEVLPTAELQAVPEVSFDEVRQELHILAARHEVTLRAFDRSSFAHGIGPVFADHLRVSDLGVMHYPAAPSIAAKMVAAAAVFDGGAPVLLLPVAAASPASLPVSIVVGWNGSAEAARALHAAITLAGDDGKITVVGIADDSTFRPGQSGVEAAHLAAKHGVRASFEVVDGGSDQAIDVLEHHCAVTDADLLVLGGVRHGVLHEMLFGSSTTDLLQSGARMPTLLVA